jgi:choline dehydrogenase
MEAFDYIVVGAGSAGCALAGRLSEDPSVSVLLLEAGGSDRRLWVRMPIGYGKSFHDRGVNWRYRTLPDPGIAGQEAYWPRGKVIGGSSSINAMVYARGLSADYDDWRDAGNPGWGWSDVQPVFEQIERRVYADGRQAGTGPLWVSYRENEYHAIKRHFLDAAREIGLPFTGDINGPSPEGVTAYPINTRDGFRCSSADAFLAPARARRNLVVHSNALTTRILFDGRAACGVEYRRGGVATAASARAEVIVAAGAVNAPQLLQLSGIGPAEVLRAAGIPVLHHNASVGGGLQDHLGISYFFRATEPTLNQCLGTWSGRIRSAMTYALSRQGPLSLSVNQMGGLVRSSPALTRPDVQLYFSPASYSVSTPGKRQLMRPDAFPGFILGFNPCRPQSRGRIDITGPDPFAPPAIRPNSLSQEADVAGVLAAARLVQRLRNSNAMRSLIAGALQFDPGKANDQALLDDFRRRCGTVYHPCGTCRMAPADRGGVVGADLKVHGVERLRVADASVFPNVTSANTNAPSIMVGFRAAAIIARDHRRRA